MDGRYASGEAAQTVNPPGKKIRSGGCADKHLLASPRFLETVFDNLQDGISILDCNLNIIKVNSWMERKFSSRMPVLGKKCYSVYQQRQAPCPWCPSLKSLKSGKTFSEVVPYSTGPSHTGWWYVSVSPLRDDKGEVRAIIEHLKDITELIKAENRLVKARQEAVEASRAKSEFMANVSHEFRTPLNAIVGLNHLLGETELTGGQRKYVEEMDLAAGRLQEIIYEILDFSRIEAGKLAVRADKFDLERILSNICEKVGRKARRKGLAFNCFRGREVPANLVGDPVWMEQILTHLADNAVKFTESGKVMVAVDLVKRDAHRATLTFSVRDTGIGLGGEEIERLFQSFYRVDGSYSREHDGVGLGLAICSRVIRMMGGEIGVESEPGKGSRFFFTLEFDYDHDIGRQPANETAAKDIEAPDASALAPKLRHLAGLLELNDTGAEAVFEQIRETLETEFPEKARQLEKGLEGFDFKGALDVLEQIGLSLGILLKD